jgi:hypothetical protein
MVGLGPAAYFWSWATGPRASKKENTIALAAPERVYEAEEHRALPSGPRGPEEKSMDLKSKSETHEKHAHGAHPGCRQIDGGWMVAITAYSALGQPFPVACVVTTTVSIEITLGTNTPYTAPASTECWYVDTTNLQYLSNSGYTVKFTSTALGTSATVPSTFSGSGSGSTPYFTTPEAATWSPSAPVVAAGVTPCYFKGADPTGTPVWARFDRTGSTAWALSQVVWYWVAATAPSGGTILPSGTFAFESSGPTGTFWTAVSAPS